MGVFTLLGSAGLGEQYSKTMNILLDIIYIHQMWSVSHRNISNIQHYCQHVYGRQVLAKYTKVIPITTGVVSYYYTCQIQ